MYQSIILRATIKFTGLLVLQLVVNLLLKSLRNLESSPKHTWNPVEHVVKTPLLYQDTYACVRPSYCILLSALADGYFIRFLWFTARFIFTRTMLLTMWASQFLLPAVQVGLRCQCIIRAHKMMPLTAAVHRSMFCELVRQNISKIEWPKLLLSPLTFCEKII